MNARISFFVRLAIWVLPALAACFSVAGAQTFDGGFDRILAPGGAPAQIGPYGGVTYSLHNGEFVTTERNIVCCEFNEGRGFGPAAGIRMNISIGESFFIAPAVGFESRGGRFESAPERLPIFGRNNEVETLTFQSQLDVSLATINIEALAGYRIGGSGLYVTAGPAAGIVVSQNYRKSERIVDPTGVRYLDGSTEKELYDGDMGLVRTATVSARAGIGASIAIADGVALNPQVLYSLPLGAASNDGAWTIAGVHGTLGVLFDL